MARISKKVVKSAAESLNGRIFKAAVYARLSVEDSDETGGGAIENQILLVRKYIENKPYLELCGIFTDNGCTGTHFKREGFQNMTAAIKRGEIDCVVVKDLSRFGRNYIETGNYLEEVFPFLKVRFISVNDDYDSYIPTEDGGNLTVILKNLVNDIYAKDISEKVRSAYEIKQRKGEFLGSYAAYGYVRSADRHKLDIDEKTAPVVRNIFRWKLEGMSNAGIMRKLEELRIPPPSNYLYSKGFLRNEKYAGKMLWNTDTIRNILSNQVYIGHMVQGKETSGIDFGLKSKRRPRDKWIIVENTHEPIIEAEIFYKVRDITAERALKYNRLRD